MFQRMFSSGFSLQRIWWKPPGFPAGRKTQGSARSRAGIPSSGLIHKAVTACGEWFTVPANQAFFGCEDQFQWMVNVDGKWLMDCWNMLEICGNMEYVWKWIWKILMKYPPTVQSPSIDDPADVSKVGTIATMGDQNSSGMIFLWHPHVEPKRCVFFTSTIFLT